MAAYNSSQYSLNPNKPLFSFDGDDDIDDELFLKNSRKPQNSTVDSQIAQLQTRKENITNNTLASTERSLALLRESEQVGISTATELAHQREQLERSSRNLDSINATLRSTQRNIDGIKSVFSSFKNYLTRPKDTGLPASTKQGPATSEPPETSDLPASTANRFSSNHNSTPSAQQTQASTPRSGQDAIDRNLSLMSANIGNLRGLALNLGDEILEQNELLDSMQYKADMADTTMQRQNLQMNRLLGKK